MTEPTPAMTRAQLTSAIVAAARELSMANRARDIPGADAARGALEALVAMRDAL